MKNSLRLTVPIMADEMADIYLMLGELAGQVGNRPAQSVILIKKIITQYPMGIEVDDKQVQGVDRTSFDRALLIVNVPEVPLQAHHLDWLSSGELPTVVSLLRWAVSRHNWSIEMKEF